MLCLCKQVCLQVYVKHNCERIKKETDDFSFEFREDNFIDVIENDVYDMAVLLYREYFLLLRTQQEKILKLIVASFGKANGQLEAKAFLIKRFMTHMRFE